MHLQVKKMFMFFTYRTFLISKMKFTTDHDEDPPVSALQLPIYTLYLNRLLVGPWLVVFFSVIITIFFKQIFKIFNKSRILFRYFIIGIHACIALYNLTEGLQCVLMATFFWITRIVKKHF